MKQILFATGNNTKFHTANLICQEYGIELERLSLDIPEIQAQESEVIARDKALRVFEELQRPVVISDDTWIIPGIGGFPGPYMKFVNGAFMPEDWLHLTASLTDRRIILRQIVVYQDKHQQQLFYIDIEGVLLDEIRGKGEYPHTTVASFDGGKHSMAEVIAQGKSSLFDSGKRTTWHDLCEWLNTQDTKTN